MTVSAEIFTKPSCPYCVKAKSLLTENNITFSEKIVGKDISKDDIQEIVDNMGVETTIRTVPQIFFHNASVGRVEYIGGYTELTKYFED